ncbi:hypothetical protein [Salinivirga cyanobacteriivorans]|uniref:hypothetical protein n=1 Tax=Salinivirga cyanobacteriivorans TaxID=1307839 RepID=UPI000716D65F|nr:hypothetical protein [Salinivirga cyanobacteriivorans]
MKYSIDQGKVGKSGTVGIKYRLEQFKKKRESRKEERVYQRSLRKNERAIKRFNRKFQDKRTKKMMKRSARKSKRVNKGKNQYNVFERILNSTAEYGRILGDYNYGFDWIRRTFDQCFSKKKKP